MKFGPKTPLQTTTTNLNFENDETDCKVDEPHICQGMAEKTTDQRFEECRVMLNEMVEKINSLLKAFQKHAESLEAMQPAKPLTEPYELNVDGETNINMSEVFKAISIVIAEYGQERNFCSFAKMRCRFAIC